MALGRSRTSVSPVYGPVRSWRFGRSLGIDPIGEISTCSFNCIYCQLGEIQRVTAERGEFVEAERLAVDLERVDWDEVDVVTFSGSGEPTLATNLAQMVGLVKERTRAPVHVLTNATLFHLSEARAAVAQMDVIACKLDAASPEMLEKFNRPARGVTIESIVQGIELLKGEYRGRIELQIMLMPMNLGELEAMIPLIRRVAPYSVQLNTPRRPYPLAWHVETRGGGSHNAEEIHWPTRRLAVVTPEEAKAAEEKIRGATGVELVSVYRV